ncbi:MAG: S-layer homology domain-containing protein [Clostridia bacterium]|nr:S-layer homology domain-containing protein [Clostridia bacterium]
MSEWARASVAQAVENGFMDGMDDNMFNPSFTATRAQAATVILRVLNK